MLRRVSFAVLVIVVMLTACTAPATTAPTAAPTKAPAVAATTAPAATVAPTKAAATAAPAATVAPTKAATTGAATGEPIYIGLTGPWTGSGAQQGEFAQVGAELARDQINATGGINGRPIQLVIYDSKGDPQEAALVAQRYVEDKRIQAIIGPLWSAEAMAAMPIYEEAKMPVFCPTGSADNITAQGWKQIIRITSKSSVQSPQQVAFLVNNLGRKKIAVFFANDDNGRSALAAAKKVAEGLGATVVDEEPVNTNIDTDFTVQLTRAQKAGAEGVFISLQYNEGSLVVSQAAQLGLTKDKKMVFVSSGALIQDVVRQRVSKDAQDAFYIVMPDDFFSDRPVVKTLREHFLNVKKTFVNQTAAMSYDAIYVWATAMRAGATKETVIEKAKTMTFTNLICGESMSWDAKGDRTAIESGVVQVKDGQFVSANVKVDLKGLQITK